MAEDDMLMNFSIDEESLGAKPIFKGGRWKDRLQAKKSLLRRREKSISNSTLTGSNAVPTRPRPPISKDDDNRPAKKQKLNGPTHTTSKSHDTTTKPKEFISSLFTSNPAAKPRTPSQPQIPDAQATSPSNAPLPASASPFTSLGLSPFLSTHLTENLGLNAPTAVQKAALTHLLKIDTDAFIQAETGSGKTLAYLLPILQRILALSQHSQSNKDGRKIDRTSGLFALILAPTRELTHQISSVLEKLLRPLPWLVSGTVTGGSTKNHEKRRLRKGLNILVATPGRLVDHLENTNVLDVGGVRWVVLDEGDRLMELGFEEDVKATLGKLDERRIAWAKGERALKGLPEKRTTVLCSATMKLGVQRLGEMSLKDAVHIKADLAASTSGESKEIATDGAKEEAFLAPAQLKQSYIVVPPKQRLVTLAALLKRTFARKGSVMKVMVFLSCADSVDFHFEVFGRKESQAPKETTSSDQKTRTLEKPPKAEPEPSSPGSKDKPKARATTAKPDLPTVTSASILSSPSNPGLSLYKLHGSLEQKVRTATLQSFTRSPSPSILLCTDVASRGLDVPNIDIVIEYDPPFSADDHLHRVGRTARAGKEGRACCFLMPGGEEEYVDVLRECAGGGVMKSEKAEEILKKAFAVVGSKDASLAKWDERATDFQLDVERWIIEDKRIGEQARKAFVSHVRAYATHVVAERAMFDVKSLHLGHLAKAFALRERPGNMGRGTTVGDGKVVRKPQGESRRRIKDGEKKNADGGAPKRDDLDLPKSEDHDAAKKMRKAMKAKMAGGASEFNIG
ncbi:ATP-dependent RNA helicase dbp7 [Puttea exsequens]|nr:ATP-dependent RNA helicase dbp7 [Puttea exsequens]